MLKGNIYQRYKPLIFKTTTDLRGDKPKRKQTGPNQHLFLPTWAHFCTSPLRKQHPYLILGHPKASNTAQHQWRVTPLQWVGPGDRGAHNPRASSTNTATHAVKQTAPSHPTNQHAACVNATVHSIQKSSFPPSRRMRQIDVLWSLKQDNFMQLSFKTIKSGTNCWTHQQ